MLKNKIKRYLKQVKRSEASLLPTKDFLLRNSKFTQSVENFQKKKTEKIIEIPQVGHLESLEDQN